MNAGSGLAIAVLGMHRSGTSCLTGLLQDAGVQLGDVQRRNPHNPLGNRENLRIMHLHDAVLSHNGARWDRPPRGPATWSGTQRAELRAILQEYEGHARWAFKDPRTLFTLDGWLAELPGLAMIGSFRHPLAVARSLRARSGMTLAPALALWVRYNERLLDLRADFGFDLVSFDLPPDAYLDAVVRAFARLGLPAERGALRFFRDDLRQRDAAPDPAGEEAEEADALPPAVRSLYERLEGAAA